MTGSRMIHLMDIRDRDLLRRWALDGGTGSMTRWSWIIVTHAGGALVTIASVLIPLLLPPWARAITLRAAAALVVSHLLVQFLKRHVSRARPPLRALVRCPDCYSFPSGHATAALAVSLSYAFAFPSVAVPLVSFGMLVGWSRVVLGVHYPGDVLVGQIIAVLTVGVAGLI